MKGKKKTIISKCLIAENKNHLIYILTSVEMQSKYCIKDLHLEIKFISFSTSVKVLS